MKTALKRIYQIIPFKREVFSFIKLLGSPSESIYKHLYFKGNFTVHIDPTHSFIIRHYGFVVENSLFWKGLDDWERKSLDIWITLAKTSSVIFDIGANTGVYSLCAKSVNSSAQVFALEPVTRVYEKLCRNIELNDYDVVALETAASNANGTAEIYDMAGEHEYAATLDRDIYSNFELIESTVKTARLDTLIEQRGIETIDLIKIDVEGHDPEVLIGLGKYLNICKPSILIEVLSDDAGHRIHELLSPLDYLFFYIDENSRTALRVNMLSAREHHNYLACRKEVAEDLNLEVLQ
jgi:FkbM family methyltransferase